jgi:hypothetical protein
VTAERDYCDFPNDMVLACHSIIPFVDGMSLDNYLADEKTRYAVMRAYEILGRGSPASAGTYEDGQCGHSLGDDGRRAQPDCTWVAFTANHGWTEYAQAGAGCVDP